MLLQKGLNLPSGELVDRQVSELGDVFLKLLKRLVEALVHR